MNESEPSMNLAEAIDVIENSPVDHVHIGWAGVSRAVAAWAIVKTELDRRGAIEQQARALLAELDDDLAGQLGDVETLERLRRSLGGPWS